jgi:hypothetical protein
MKADISGFVPGNLKGRRRMTPNRHGLRWLAWVGGTLLITGMTLTMVPEDVPAQTTKTDKKKTDTKSKTDKTKTDAKTDAKKEAKLEPPPANMPKRVDIYDGSNGGAEQVVYIDELIQKNWKENKSYPSDRCSDYEFIRRASLDIIGRIPTVEEIASYMRHPDKTRRSWLINAMLDGKEYGYGQEYAQNFANLWTVHLMTRTGSMNHYRAQMNDWLYSQFKGDEKQTPDWSKTAHDLIAGEGDTNRNAAVNYLLHNLGEEIKQDPVKNGKWDMVPATSRTTRLFLGIRTQCVQCHDHPFNGEWGQHHFWGINAFLRQTETNGRPAMMMAKKKKKGELGNQEYTVKDNPSFNGNGLISYERRNTVLLVTDSTFLNGKKIPKGFKGTRREALAKFITDDPSFAKAFVNRTWGHFFGKSFTKDNPDDFGEHNPISHPELLERLSEDWSKKYGHNPKMLVRWIANSQAYGLSSRANKWNDKTEDETLFARILLKPMTPEQMFESLMIATAAKLGQDKEKKFEAKEKWFERLIVNFGNDEGEEGSYTGTVIQALLLMNGQDINNAITDAKEGTVAAIVKARGATHAALPMAVQDMYMHVLSRPATKQEVLDFTSPRMFSFREASKTNPNTPQFWTNYYQDIMWALLNSGEFILNH